MQPMEIHDYMNERPRRGQRNSGDRNQTERILCLLLLGFGGLCIIQAILNVSLRLTLCAGKESPQSDRNATNLCEKNQVTMVQDCEHKWPRHCNELQERFNDLTGEKNLLVNEKSKLNNEIRKLTRERDMLRTKLKELGCCVCSQRCPPNWREINSRCYFLSTEQKTWEDSRRSCQTEGADLVVINNEQEQRALYRLNQSEYLLFWIGLYDAAGTFKWVDGSALNKSFWQAGQPDHGGPNNREDCVEMYHSNPVLANWNDAPCGHKLHWLCEKDPCNQP